MISHKKKFIYIHIPKTGGNSLSLYLKNYSSNKVIQRNSRVGLGQGIDIICEKSKIDIKHMPITYYRGLYPNLYSSYIKFTIVRNPYDRLISLYFWLRSNRPYTKKSFKEFLNKNIKSQLSFIMVDDKIEVDYICKFENLEEDLKYIFNKINIDTKDMVFPHLNASKHNYYMSYYDNELLSIINKKYENDFKVLGYDIITSV